MTGCERVWNGFEIRPSKDGKAWIWTEWSRVQGHLTGARLYIPVTDEFPANVDWDEPVDGFADQAEAFNDRAHEVWTYTPAERRRLGIKLLSRGWYVAVPTGRPQRRAPGGRR